MQARWVSVLAMSWLCVACNGEDAKDEEQPPPPPSAAAVKLDSYKKGSVSTSDSALVWAKKASAPLMYLQISTASSLGSSTPDGGARDPSCPVETDEGLTTRKTGGCTDKNGVEWVGSMTESFSVTGGFTYTYSGFGYHHTVSCGDKSARGKLVYDGTVTLSASGETQGFEAQLIQEALTIDESTCAETVVSSAMEYKGSVTGVSSKDESKPSTWNGSGRIGTPELGTISAETRNEVIHSQTCAFEAISGGTTLTGDNHKVDITYDGATDCATDATVQWSLDGAAQGKLEGVACAAANGPTLALWGVGVFGLLGVMRRRVRD